jgi:uncharacterized membrane protein YtjA (UPF0391 family)
MSKPTWLNTAGFSATSVFFVLHAAMVTPLGSRPCGFYQEDLTMLQLAVFLLVVALLAGLLGFGGLAGSFVGLAKIVFFVFLILAVLSFVFGGNLFRRRYFWQ